MTTNLHDKMLAAIDAYFSASDAVEEEVAENLLLDVRDEINKHKLAAESLTEGLRLDDWPQIGCVNHDCDQCKAQQEPVAWMNPHGGMLTANYIENFASGLDKEIHNIPLYTTPQAQPARESIKWADHEPDGTRQKPLEEKLKDAFYEGFTSSATYNDIELNDVDEEWLKYAAAHGITKGTK